MKHKGALMEYSDERAQDLYRAYSQYIDRHKTISHSEMYRDIANMESSRFWVSVDRATIVVSAIMRGNDILKSMWPLRREMYSEIYKRVCILKKDKNLPLPVLCEMVITQKAPKFYLTECSVKFILSKQRRKIAERLKRRWG